MDKTNHILNISVSLSLHANIFMKDVYPSLFKLLLQLNSWDRLGSKALVEQLV